MSIIIYKTDIANVDWAGLKMILQQDSFDNGRSPAQYSRSFNQSAVACLAYDGDQIIGTARALSDGVCNAYIADVWVLSSYRRRGVAKTMMNIVLNHLSGQHVYLFTDDMQDFYKHLGFKEQPTGMGKVVGTWLQNNLTKDDIVE